MEYLEGFEAVEEVVVVVDDDDDNEEVEDECE